ncbi:MAG TPA: hypothetical protein VFU88_13305 [Ktedonobacterales bacterium]|nr:hypothetical protein [Ktedonobacterales bacterium]
MKRQVRLREHAEVRAALRLERVPDYTTLQSQRAPDGRGRTDTAATHETIRRRAAY